MKALTQTFNYTLMILEILKSTSKSPIFYSIYRKDENKIFTSFIIMLENEKYKIFTVNAHMISVLDVMEFIPSIDSNDSLHLHKRSISLFKEIQNSNTDIVVIKGISIASSFVKEQILTYFVKNIPKDFTQKIVFIDDLSSFEGDQPIMNRVFKINGKI